ncbi:MAG: cation transporter [Clostridiales bacterium]|nr:cation transporter [Clostridiales bacterium]
MTATVIIILAALLVVWAVWRTVQKVRGKAKSSCCGTAEVVAAKKVADTDESHYPYQYKLSVEGMMCSNCARTVENALNEADGVWARVDLGRKEAKVLTKAPRTQADFAALLNGYSYSVTGCTKTGR